MSKCENCRLRKESARAFDIHWHGEDDCPYEVCPEIKTNADRIRSMTDEELAEWLEDRFQLPINGLWLDWLKQETEEGE